MKLGRGIKKNSKNGWVTNNGGFVNKWLGFETSANYADSWAWLGWTPNTTPDAIEYEFFFFNPDVIHLSEITTTTLKQRSKELCLTLSNHP